MKKYLLRIGLLLLLLIGLGTIKSQARIYTNDPTANSGGTVTVTVSSQESVASYYVDISSNTGVTKTGVSAPSNVSATPMGNGITGMLASGETTTLAYFTFSVPTVTTDTTYKVTFTSSNLIKEDMATKVAGSTATATITVKAPAQNNPSPKPSPKPSPAAPTFSSLNETVYAKQDVNVRSSYSTSSSKLGQLKQGESVVRTGASNIAVGGYYWSKVTFNGQTGYIASNYLTTTKPEQTTPSPATSPTPSTSPSPEAKSNDATLKSLSITGVELTPVFASDITSYTASVGEEVTEVEVIAEVNNEKATYEITGNKNLQEGENTIIVTVTAEDGTVTNYEIKLAKGKQIVPVGLVINGIKENGEKVELSLGAATVVSENIIEYTINLNEWLKSVEILNTLGRVDAFEGTGTFDLQVGENKYTITSKVAEEGEEAKTIEYRITINNPEKKVEEVKEENGLSLKMKLIIAGIVVVVGIVIIGLIVHYKRQNKVEYGSTDYSFLKNDETIQSKEQERQQDRFNDDDMPNDNGGERRKGGKHF